ncbi:protein NIM1-INTERACTING 3 [Abrus precatorius]|uniref:Protein NIM1-INTERACTING 3 n=1 Tax=Abrus precatorius TaxID=3816 RepID=A0A8B8MG54_ABRPR|nr:protein NIM1-INTERACTING 3 [Abrus precatorius]
MEGERRKRKIEKEEESEEVQMEKFFALIKSTKDVRDRLCKEKEEEKAKGVWKPTFQPEDFIDDEDLVRINIMPAPAPATEATGPSGKETKDGVDKDSAEASAAAPLDENGSKNKACDDDLDLTLSL